MAWTAPMTAASGTVWTAAQYNTHIRDNLLETMPAKATAANRIFASTGPNAIAERVPSSASVATSQTTTSTSYTNLATVGPAVTVTTGTKAIAFGQAYMENNTTNVASAFSIAVSGATTLAASDVGCARSVVTGSTQSNHWGFAHMFDTLNAGSNTFTMQYKVTAASTGTFANRELIVIPL
jgi:hypothetical protein